jgi:hypothetical protein
MSTRPQPQGLHGTTRHFWRPVPTELYRRGPTVWCRSRRRSTAANRSSQPSNSRSKSEISPRAVQDSIRQSPAWRGRTILGGNYDSGSDFVQLARPLVDGYVDIRFTQEQGCREPSEPRSGNGNVQRHRDPPRLRRALQLFRMRADQAQRQADCQDPPARPSRQRRGATGSFPTIPDLAARLPPRQT